MADKTLTVSKLNTAAQKTAVESFAAFYVSAYMTVGVDVFAQSGVAANVTDINDWLFDNATFSFDEKKQGVVEAREADFLAILKKIRNHYDSNGRPQLAWKDWYEEQVAKIPQGK